MCIGRTFLYALNYGEDGVEHFIKSKDPTPSSSFFHFVFFHDNMLTRRVFLLRRRIVLQSELEAEMRLLGITSLSQAHPGLVNTRDLDYLVAGYTDRPRRLEPAKL